jgi:hypothetical protein
MAMMMEGRWSSRQRLFLLMGMGTGFDDCSVTANCRNSSGFLGTESAGGRGRAGEEQSFCC